MIRINLLPRAPKRRVPSRRILEIGLPLLTLAVVGALFISITGQVEGLKRELADTLKAIEAIKPEVARVEELDRQIVLLKDREGMIAALLKQQLPAAAILNEVRLLIPRDVWLTSMSVPEPSSINLDGLAMNYHAVARLMDNLATGRLFRVVDMTVVQLEKVGLREIVKFSVNARIDRPQAAGGERQ